MSRTRKADPRTAAAHRQAAKPGCANPNGWARWDFDAETEELRLRGEKKPKGRDGGCNPRKDHDNEKGGEE